MGRHMTSFSSRCSILVLLHVRTTNLPFQNEEEWRKKVFTDVNLIFQMCFLRVTCPDVHLSHTKLNYCSYKPTVVKISWLKNQLYFPEWNNKCTYYSRERRKRSFFFCLWRCDPTRVMASSFLRFLDHTQRRTTVGRTPLDEWSARRRDLYVTTHNTHNRQTSLPPVVGFEPMISAGERPQTYALDRAATGTGKRIHILIWNKRESTEMATFFFLNVTYELYGCFLYSRHT